MGSGLKLPHDAWVLVGDGRKALFLQNEGDDRFPNLKTRRVFQSGKNPPTHEQGADRPGRAVMGTHRSAVDQTDWHDLEEHKFVADVAAALRALHRAAPLKALVIVAPPRALADLRHALPREIAELILAEIDKDLTKIPVYEIERHLTSQ